MRERESERVSERKKTKTVKQLLQDLSFIDSLFCPNTKDVYAYLILFSVPLLSVIFFIMTCRHRECDLSWSCYCAWQLHIIVIIITSIIIHYHPPPSSYSSCVGQRKWQHFSARISCLIWRKNTVLYTFLTQTHQKSQKWWWTDIK